MILCVRHGESEANRDMVYGGHTQTPLTDLGVIQAQKTSDTLQDYDIDRVISSDLTRAFQTAEVVEKNLDKNIVIEASELLREACTGEYDGTPIIPGVSVLERGMQSDSGESLEDIHARGAKALDFLKRLDPDQCILVVGHNSFFAVLFALNEGEEDILAYRKKWHMENASVKELIIR